MDCYYSRSKLAPRSSGSGSKSSSESSGRERPVRMEGRQRQMEAHKARTPCVRPTALCPPPTWSARSRSRWIGSAASCRAWLPSMQFATLIGSFGLSIGSQAVQEAREV
ncbi:unnamed protein product [Pylaiella littoralis]